MILPQTTNGKNINLGLVNVNRDSELIEDFGDEWQRYSYQDFDRSALEANFKQYFDIFPWDQISEHSEGFDMGCGSG